MDSLKCWSSEKELLRVQSSREELIARLTQANRVDGITEPMEGLRFRRASAPTEMGHGVSDPSFCVIVQGSKEIFLGDRRYSYDPAHYLIATTALPISSRIAEASVKRPYLSVILTLDPTLISSVMIETNYVTPRSRTAVTAIDVSALDVGLLDAIVRLVRLLDAPHDRSFFASLIKREIVYRLLCGEQRARLVQMAALGGSTIRIAEALNLLRKNFDQPLHVEAIARELGMSISSFHHHFKSLTAMSPLQYQKQLRLQEARRLMLGEGFDAASAGFRVGYSDASYFSRDYKKIFGAPPIRDIQRLQDATVANAVS